LAISADLVLLSQIHWYNQMVAMLQAYKFSNFVLVVLIIKNTA